MASAFRSVDLILGWSCARRDEPEVADGIWLDRQRGMIVDVFSDGGKVPGTGVRPGISDRKTEEFKT